MMHKFKDYALRGITVLSLMAATGALTYAWTLQGYERGANAWGQPYPAPYTAQPMQPYQATPAPAPAPAPALTAERQITPPRVVPYQPQLHSVESSTPLAVNKPIPTTAELQAYATQILNILNQLEGASSDAGRNEANAGLPPIQIFFDPRCPYCHQLYGSLAGKAPIHWIPVSILNPTEGGIGYGATIIQAEKDRPGTGGVEALKAAFDKSLATITPTDAHKASLDQNLASFAQLSQTLPPTIQAAVPFALIPKRDGTFETHVGYSAGDEVSILDAYGK